MKLYKKKKSESEEAIERSVTRTVDCLELQPDAIESLRSVSERTKFHYELKNDRGNGSSWANC